jgi:hypothetical protein
LPLSIAHYPEPVLIDDRVPPADERPAVEPNWRVIGWLAVAAVLVFAGVRTTGVVAYVIICATVYAVCKAALSVGGYDYGLREWKQ